MVEAAYGIAAVADRIDGLYELLIARSRAAAGRPAAAARWARRPLPAFAASHQETSQ